MTLTKSRRLARQIAAELFTNGTSAKSAEATNAALRTALAKHAETSDVQESTPNGAAGIFYKLWLGARWPEYDAKLTATQVTNLMLKLLNFLNLFRRKRPGYRQCDHASSPDALCPRCPYPATRVSFVGGKNHYWCDEHRANYEIDKPYLQTENIEILPHAGR